MLDATTLTAGIDTAKDKLDMAVHGHTLHLTVENGAAGWKRLSPPKGFEPVLSP